MCGLIEGEFPRHDTAASILDDSLRRRLIAQGVPLATRAQARQEESFLLTLALTRATARRVLTWPRFDEKGDPKQRAYVLDQFDVAAVHPRPARIRPARAPRQMPAVVLRTAESLAELAGRFSQQRPTAIESFLQCPFQFFGRYTLGLKDVVEERLSPLELGILAHRILEQWHDSREPMDELFDRSWGNFLRDRQIAAGYPAEAARSALRRGLIRFAANPRFRDGWATSTEQRFTLELPGVRLSGRIDRIDRSPDNHVVLFDFKLTGEAGLRDRIQKQQTGALVQGGLYALALQTEGARIDGVFYVPLRSLAEPRGWEEPEVLAELMDRSARQAVESQRRILEGVIAPAPLDPRLCESCEFLSACRIASAASTQETTVQTAS